MWVTRWRAVLEALFVFPAPPLSVPGNLSQPFYSLLVLLVSAPISEGAPLLISHVLRF
jgi:hypothetical protein